MGWMVMVRPPPLLLLRPLQYLVRLEGGGVPRVGIAQCVVNVSPLHRASICSPRSMSPELTYFLVHLSHTHIVYLHSIYIHAADFYSGAGKGGLS